MADGLADVWLIAMETRGRPFEATAPPFFCERTEGPDALLGVAAPFLPEAASEPVRGF